MKILLIGGSGIISSEIFSRAIEEKHEVYILNRGKRKGTINPKAKLIIADVRKETVDELRAKLRNVYFDVIVDFVSYTPYELEKTLNFCGGSFSQFVFISTAVVYKEVSGIRYNENSEATNDLWSYAVDKAKCEEVLKRRSVNDGFVYTIIRPYITYGKTRFPLQFAPLEYYTIVNRIKSGKPIPIYGRGIKCTLTTAKDFAVGAVGLFLNPKEFNETFHITGDYETTWDNVVETIALKYGMKADIIDVSGIIQSRWKTLGVGIDEIIGDKGRNMLFDNTKIKSAVPDFVGDTPFEIAVSETIEYFEKNLSVQKINYAWDARIDRLLSFITPDKSKLKLSSYKTKPSGRERIAYIINRYALFIIAVKCLSLFKKFKGRNKAKDVITKTDI